MSTLFVSVSVSFADPNIASDTNSADCKNSTLETYSGTSNLSADWEANTINVRWYNGNTLMTSNTCVYDGGLTIPDAPSRTGYTFTGWRVRPQMDFSTIPTNTNGTERWAFGVSDNTEYCYYDTNTGVAKQVDCNSDNTYRELQTYEWKVKFSHGDLYGMSGCSSTNGTYAQSGTPTIGTGQYCWCKATGYKGTNVNRISGPSYALSWVFARDYDTVAYCTQKCAAYCTNRAEYNSDFRRALFGVSQ